MTKGAAKLIFWVGTLVSVLIFIWMTVDFHRREKDFTDPEGLTATVVAGKKVWHKYNCNNCHTILGFGAYYAPDMTKAYYRLGRSNIVNIVMHPEKVYKNSFRKMPNLGVTEEEAGQLVEFLHWTADIENRKWPPQDEKYVQAARLRETEPESLAKTDIVLGVCGGCHSFENQGRDVAGDFNDIAKSIDWDRATLIEFILDPESVDSGSGMPPQDVSRETAGLIADFVLGLK
jgi:nitric oxide reductase subunit C